MLDSFKEHEMIKDITDIQGTGHRVVHGGETFPKSVVVTDEVESQIEELSELAPLHNPANLMGIRAFRKLLPEIPHVAVFDTSFHQTMPEQAYTMKTMAYVSMVSTVQVINMYLVELLKLLVDQLKI